MRVLQLKAFLAAYAPLGAWLLVCARPAVDGELQTISAVTCLPVWCGSTEVFAVVRITQAIVTEATLIRAILAIWNLVTKTSNLYAASVVVTGVAGFGALEVRHRCAVLFIRVVHAVMVTVTDKLNWNALLPVLTKKFIRRAVYIATSFLIACIKAVGFPITMPAFRHTLAVPTAELVFVARRYVGAVAASRAVGFVRAVLTVPDTVADKGIPDAVTSATPVATVTGHSSTIFFVRPISTVVIHVTHVVKGNAALIAAPKLGHIALWVHTGFMLVRSVPFTAVLVRVARPAVRYAFSSHLASVLRCTARRVSALGRWLFI